jgi:hypothetical protein
MVRVVLCALYHSSIASFSLQVSLRAQVLVYGFVGRQFGRRSGGALCAPAHSDGNSVKLCWVCRTPSGSRGQLG